MAFIESSGARSVVFPIVCCCSLLSACGGGDASSAAPALPAAAALQAATPAALHALPGQTVVTLNAQPPLAPAAAASAATVAVRRGANGDLLLVQRDGATRTVTPEGRLTLQPQGAPTQAAADLPPSVMVAVDASNTVHMVDPQACVARRVAPDGRVTTTFLPAPAGQPCATAAPPR